IPLAPSRSATCWVQIPATGHVSLKSDADVLAADVGLKISNTELVHGATCGTFGGALRFTSRRQWRNWLERNHAVEREALLVVYKRPPKNRKFPPRAALEEALCFGWIDGWFKPHRHGTMGDSIHAEAKEIQLVQVQHSNRMEFAQSAEDDLRRRCETTEGCSRGMGEIPTSSDGNC